MNNAIRQDELLHLRKSVTAISYFPNLKMQVSEVKYFFLMFECGGIILEVYILLCYVAVVSFGLKLFFNNLIPSLVWDSRTVGRLYYVLIVAF